MPDLTLTVPVYINLDPGGPVLVRSSTNQLPLGPLRVVSGDERLFSFRLHQTPEGSTWQRVGLPSGWTMVLSGKRAPGGETAYFTNSTWTSTGSGSSLAYTATLDWAVSDSIWDNAPNGVVPFRMDLEIRDATNTVRGTVQFDLELSRENYGSGDTPDDPDSPFLDRPAADNIYVSFAAAQTLTDEQADQAISNLKGTTASTPNRLAKRTSLGWLLARAFDTDDENNGIRIQGLRHGTVTVTVSGATDQYVFDSEAFPPTGIQTGMYLYGGFPEGTTVISTDGGVITTSAGLLASGTVTVFASTSSADPRPKIVLTREGSPVFTLAYDGSITGPAATIGNLLVNGGPFQVDADGNITTTGAIAPQGPLYLYAGSQGIEHSAYSTLGLDDEGNPTFGIYSQSGASTFTGDMWLGAWSGTGQGLLMSRTGIWGYDSGGGNTFGFDTETGLAQVQSLQINSYTITLGGNISFTSTGRTLAQASSAAAAATALGLGTDSGVNFASLVTTGTITAGTAMFTYGSATDSSVTVHNGTLTNANSGLLVAVQGPGKLKAISAAEGRTALGLDAAATQALLPNKWLTFAGSNSQGYTSGTGASTNGNAFGIAVSGATAAGYAARSWEANSLGGAANTVGASAFQLSYAKTIAISCRICITSVANDTGSILLIAFGRATGNGDTTHTLARKGFALRWNPGSAAVLAVYNSGSESTVTTGFTPVASQAFDLLIVSTNGTTTCYINGTQVATTGSGPTGSNANYESCPVAGVYNTGSITNRVTAIVTQMRLFVE